MHLCSIQLPGKLQIHIFSTVERNTECAKWNVYTNRTHFDLSWGDFTTLHFTENVKGKEWFISLIRTFFFFASCIQMYKTLVGWLVGCLST